MTSADLMIIGGGVAGLTAGMYAAWQGLDAMLIDRMAGAGGVLVNLDTIENFPGFPGGIKGADLGARVGEQAAELGLRIEYGDVDELRAVDGGYEVSAQGQLFDARAVILAVGLTVARLGCPGEDTFEGRGVSYCAVCDAAFFPNQPVVVVGGGDSAVDEALYLVQSASSVQLLVRGAELDAAATLTRRALEHPKITVHLHTTVAAIEGKSSVEAVRLRDGDGRESVLACQGVFIYVGLQPGTELFRDVAPMDRLRHIPVDAWMRTPVAGLFAVGDIRQQSARQLVTVSGDGATAAIAAARYLKTGEWPVEVAATRAART